MNRPPKVRIAYVIKAVTVYDVSNRKKFQNFIDSHFGWQLSMENKWVDIKTNQYYEFWSKFDQIFYKRSLKTAITC